MGKSKKELKRFESVAFIALEALDKAIKLKSLQLDELKMKQQNESPKKYPLGGFIGEAGMKVDKAWNDESKEVEKEFVINKRDASKLVDAINSNDFQAIAVPDFVLKELFPEQFETEEEKKSREEWISRGEKMLQFIAPEFGSKKCNCPVCVAERNLKNNGQA